MLLLQHESIGKLFEENVWKLRLPNKFELEVKLQSSLCLRCFLYIHLHNIL